MSCFHVSSFPRMSSLCPRPFLSIPFYVPVIFSVCPFHFPYMAFSFIASHFPTSPFASSGFLVLCLPFSLLAFISFPFISLSVALWCLFISPCFPIMSTSCPLHVLAFSFISFPHFPVCPCIFPSLPGIFPEKQTQHVFSNVFAKGCKKQSFPEFQQKEADTPEPAKSRQGDSSLETHQTSGVGIILYPLLSIRHAEQCRRICLAYKVRCFDFSLRGPGPDVWG